MGLSDAIIKNGYKIKAYFDFGDFYDNPTHHGKEMIETIKNGFLIKKKNYYIVDKDKNLGNYFLSRSIFPYIINKNGSLTAKSYFNFSFVHYIKHLLYNFISNLFNIENKYCYKIFTILGAKFKLKRYNYKIKGKCNSIIIKDGDNKTTPKEKKIDGLKIIINGENNYIFLSPNYKFKNSKIEICADNCTIDIKSKHPVSNLNVKFKEEDYQSIIIEENSKITDLDINSNTKDILIEVKNGEIFSQSAIIKKYTDEESRPRMIVESKTRAQF